jgi:uncharacterized protein (TIGR03083 family)
MENSRYLECLQKDYLRIREVVPGHFAARVPSCPDWTVADLVRHVAQVYLHKVELMRNGKEPAVWPPEGFGQQDPLKLLDQGHTQLMSEFKARSARDATRTWYGPDQTVGFWIRRMAQETVIHRIDAELGAGALVAPVPDDLAIDGIDELLTVFVGYAFDEWPAEFTTALRESPGHSYLIRADPARQRPSVSWLVRTAPDLLTVEGGSGKLADATRSPDVLVSGTPAAVLRWAWNRESPGTTPGQSSSVVIMGGGDALDELHRCIVTATQ